MTSSQCVEEIKAAFQTMGNKSNEQIETMVDSPEARLEAEKSDHEIEVEDQESPVTKEKTSKKKSTN